MHTFFYTAKSKQQHECGPQIHLFLLKTFDVANFQKKKKKTQKIAYKLNIAKWCSLMKAGSSEAVWSLLMIAAVPCQVLFLSSQEGELFRICGFFAAQKTLFLIHGCYSNSIGTQNQKVINLPNEFSPCHLQKPYLLFPLITKKGASVGLFSQFTQFLCRFRIYML